MSETPQDRDLERYLQGSDPLSRAYDSLRDEMPSPELDRKVLLEARAAVSRTRRFPTWQSYTAIAATVVLAFALVLRFDEQLQPETTARARAPAESPAAAAGQESGDVDLVSPPPHALPQDGVATGEAPVARPPVAQGTSVYTIATDEPEPVLAEPQSVRVEQDKRGKAAAVGPTKEAAAVGGGTAARLQQPGALEETASEPASTPATAPAAPPLPTAISGPVTAEQLRGHEMSAPRETKTELTNEFGTLEVAGSRIVRSNPRPRDEWLRYIDDLRKEGKLEEAEAEKRRFLLTYPDYPAGPDPAPTK